MSTIVIKVPTSTIKKMQQFYQRELLAKKVPYTAFVAKKGQRRSLLIRLEKSCFKERLLKKKLPYGAIRQVLYRIRKKRLFQPLRCQQDLAKKASSAVTRSATAVISVLWWSVPSMPKRAIATAESLRCQGLKNADRSRDP